MPTPLASMEARASTWSYSIKLVQVTAKSHEYDTIMHANSSAAPTLGFLIPSIHCNRRDAVTIA
jgi:hypothetical protein